MQALFSTSEVAELFNVEVWRVMRLFSTGAVPEPIRIGGKRVIPREMLPQVLDALRERGWVAPAEVAP